MKKVEEVIINGEKVTLRKDFLGWHTVFPIKVDGKINWKNAIAGGNWIKLAIVIFFVLMILGAIYEYATAVSMLNECLNDSKLIVNIPYG